MIPIRKLFFLIAILVLSIADTNAQLVINEVSQGPTGAQEYVELLVVGKPTCDTIPCLDLRGYFIDDNNGTYATGGGAGIAAGCVRFSTNSLWSCIPIGTIIVIYNDLDINADIPAQDLSMSDGNCRLVIPISNCTLFEKHLSLPSMTTSSYPTSGFTGCGIWSCLSMANNDDSFQSIDASGTVISSISWGNNTTNTIIYFAGTASATVAYMTNAIDDDPLKQGNWTSVSTTGNQTPGLPNNTANAAWIKSMNNSCTALTPLTLASTIVDAGCICNGSASVVPSGAMAPYTFAWSTTSIASGITGVCAGNYIVTVTSSNGCVQTTSVTVSSSSPLAITTSNSSVNCSGEANGTASASATGGAGSYSYSWLPSGGTAATANALVAGEYTVIVTDANGCTGTTKVTISEPPIITMPTSTITNATCNQSNGSAIAHTSGGTGTLNYSWNTGATGQTITNLAAGTYTLTVIDNNNCTKTQSISISNTPGPSINSLSPTSILCKGNSNGAASVSASGTAPLTYSWNTSATGVTISNISAGSYTLTVTDVNGCQAISTVSITEPSSSLTISSITPTNATCGASDGSAVANASGGTGTLTYSWSTNATGQTTTGLSAGIYTITVTDGNVCSKTATTIITNSSGPSAIATISSSIVCNGGTGNISVTASGGMANYTYAWSTGASTVTSSVNNAISGITANNYTVTITDANGCIATSIVNLNEPAAILPTFTVTNATCNQNDGSAIASASGGTGTLNYSWNTGATGQTINNLAAGTYTLTVTDNNNCTKTQNISISNTPAPTINSLSPTPILCKGNNNGAASVSASGTAPLTYSWNTSATGVTISNVTAGTYTLTVTDANGCQAIRTVSITEPASTITITTQTDVNCGTNDGIAVANASGGTGTLAYSWSTNATGQTATGLSAGIYTVTVTDGNACSKTATTTIINVSGPTATISNSILCNGGTGSISLTVNGGTANYTYAWSTGISTVTPSANNGISGITANNYTVTITDANGCIFTSIVTLTEPAAIALPTFTITDATCNQTNGSAIASTSGGTGTLNYSWNTGATGQTINNLATGTYTLTVTDINNCTITQSVSISNTFAPTINSLSPTPILCMGNSNGAVSVSASGTAPLTYSWNTSATGVTISNVAAGTYTLTVTDANGCQAISTVSITEPANALSIFSVTQTNANCGASDGSALTNASGGTGTLTYSWNTNATGQTATGLSPGIYTVTVTDGNACSQTATATIINNSGPTATATISSSIVCNGGTGSISVTASGGTTDYTYSWSTGASAVTSSVNDSISGITANNYTVTITDANGCTTTSSVNLNEPAAISLPTFTVIDAACNQSNGSAIASASGGSGILSYNWNNGTTGITASNLAAGNYMVTVTDANACTKTAATSVASTGLPTVISSISSGIICNGGVGSAIASVSGGIAPYTFNWSTGASSVTTNSTFQISNLTAANYTITITDNGGCSSSSIVSLTEPPPLTLTPTINTMCGDSNGSVTVTIINGTNPYTFDWSTGTMAITNSLSDSIFNLTAGNYGVTVTDGNGCTSTVNTVLAASKGTITISPVQQTIIEGNSVTLTASGGTTYTWAPAIGLSCTNCSNPVATPLTSTTYTITATVDGCIVTALIALTVKTPCNDNSDLFVANIFSPNADGRNDVISVEGNGIKNMYWAIYDRWGNLSFETFDQKHGWDGTKNGNAMEVGTYVYYLKASCSMTNSQIQLKGTISLVR